MSFICHIHNYTEYNEEWNVFSAFNPSKCTHLEQWAADCPAPGEQSWTFCRSRDSNPQPWVTSGFKSNALSIRPTTAQGLCPGFITRVYAADRRTTLVPQRTVWQTDLKITIVFLIYENSSEPLCKQGTFSIFWQGSLSDMNKCSFCNVNRTVIWSLITFS